MMLSEAHTTVSLHSRANAVRWVLQRVTGLGLVLFLALHFWVQHMPNGYLATAEEYNRIVTEFAGKGQGFVDAVEKGAIRKALPGEHVITYSKVVERLQNPWWKAIDIMLQLFGIMHALNGLNNVLTDYISRSALRSWLMVGAVLGSLWLSYTGIVSILAAGNGL